MRFTEISEAIKQLDEINMGAKSLRKLVAQIPGAQAGMEFELILPDISVDEEGDLEPNYDEDQRTRSFSDIFDFFYDGDYNSRMDVSRMLESVQQEFYEWVDEKIHEDWYDDRASYVLEWVKNNVGADELGDALGMEPDDEGNYDVSREDYATYADKCIEEENNDYEQAREEYLDENRGDIDESEWLDRNYPYMSDIENDFDINWPYWTSSGGEAEMNIEQVAGEFESMIGKKVHWSQSYHGGKREPNAYTIEPDSSLDGNEPGDSGLEFISPPMSIDEMFSDLDKITAWAKQHGVYTNNSTGLHMNVSVPDMSTAKLDYVKLALLLGDESVLEQFGRTGSHYAKSAMQIIKDRVRDNPDQAAALLEEMKSKLGVLASKAIHTGETNKFTSINTKGNYVEFRSPGGNWLADGLDKVKNTLMRFVVALDAAMDPAKYRNEYLKKLYSLLNPKGTGNDTMAYFAKYAAGEMPKAALKSFVKQARLEREMTKGKLPAGKKYWWEVKRPGYFTSIEVVAGTKEEAIKRATSAPDGYPDWAPYSSRLIAKPLRPYEEPQGGKGNWGIFRLSDGNRMKAHGEYVEFENVTQAEAQQQAKALITRANRSPDDFEVRPIEPEQPAQQQIRRWRVYPDGYGDFIEVRAATKADALQRALDQRSEWSEYDTDDMVIMPVNGHYQAQQEPQQPAQQTQSTQGQNQVGQIYRPPAAGNWTGQWLLVDSNNKIIYKFGGIGNSQNDANRHALSWLRQNPEYIQQGSSVVPEMA